MANSKVVFAGETIIDLTNDTVSSDVLLSGETAHKADGTQCTGNVVIQVFRTGSSAPSNSLGNNGDLYLQTGA